MRSLLDKPSLHCYSVQKIQDCERDKYLLSGQNVSDETLTESRGMVRRGGPTEAKSNRESAR